MSHWQRVVLMGQFILIILAFIVFLTRGLAPIVNEGETMAIADPSSPFNGAWVWLQDVAFWLIVPIILAGVVLYLMFGPAQEELQKERRRRGL